MSAPSVVNNNFTVVKGPDLSTLSNRMRYAATVLAEASRRYHGVSGRDADYTDWRPVNLRSVSIDFDREDDAVAEGEARLEDLAREIFAAANSGEWDNPSAAYARDLYRGIARHLIAAGYAKTAAPTQEN